jgi:3-dehydroquinate synthase
MAAELSRMKGWLSEQDVGRIEQSFSCLGVPVRGPAMAVDRYVELMQHDKKVQNGKMNLVLLEQIGRAVSTNAALMSDVTNAIACRT